MGVTKFPNHLKAAARAGALIADPSRSAQPYRQITRVMSMGEASSVLVGVGANPMPSEDPKVRDQLIEQALDVKPTDWYQRVNIYRNEIEDDQTGELINRFNGVAESYERHKNKRVFTLLNAGDSQTYGACYDGQDFFDSDHADEGAEYQTDQDNEYALTLTSANFNTVWTAHSKVKDDRGEVAGFSPNLLVAAVELKKEAHNIAMNEMEFGTADNDLNPFEGLSYLTSPELDSTAWYTIAAGESTKPFILVDREAPYLQEITFDSDQPNGGLFTIKYHARYKVVYGDWRLAFQGNT